MINSQNHKIFTSWLFFVYLAISSCSNDHNQEIAKNIDLEFELTYRYVITNMHTEIDYSDNFSVMKKNNKDAFTSIAYTWHMISLDECELKDSNSSKSNKSGYEQMINQSPINDNLTKPIMDSERPCLAGVYFKNWSNIQNMLLLSFPSLK